METERKFLVESLPENVEAFPFSTIEQAYISRDPVIRLRRRDDEYILTVKGQGLLSREEFELPLSREAYLRLSQKTEGSVINKRRYLIPFGKYTVELDVFAPPLAPLILAEVEFSSEDEALSFTPPDWFSREVTYDPGYTNAALSVRNI